MDLDERKKKILSSVVEDYIESAEPVGSKALVEKYGLKYSSATIRNEMKILEEEGYLEQPHVSAGRIPSTKGYRYYVDNLMKEKNLSMIDIDYINNSISGYGDTEKMLEQAAKTISKILLRPTVLTLKSEELIESVKIVKISEKILLIVFMSKNGTVKDTIVKLTGSVPEETLMELNGVLNQNLLGTPLEKLHIVLSKIIEKELDKYSRIIGDICNSIKEDMSENGNKLSTNMESILNLPEFSDIQKAKNFLNLLSTKSIIDTTLENSNHGKLGIIIGSESQELLLNDYSIISLDIETDDGHKGKLSVISPKRIDYSKTISTLRYINEKIKDVFSKDGKIKKREDD